MRPRFVLKVVRGAAGFVVAIVCGASLAFSGGIAQGQPGAEPSPVQVESTSPSPASQAFNPSSFENRRAVALTVRVITSILDVRPGMTVTEAREKLNKLADTKKPPLQEGGDAEEKKGGKDDDDDAPGRVAGRTDADRKGDGDDDDETDTPDKKAAPRMATSKKKAVPDDDDNDGTRILWKMAPGTPFEWVFIIAGKDEKISAVLGYSWKDKPIPFTEIGDVSKAPIHTPNQVAWDSLQPPLHYRIVADGINEHAAQVSISFAAVRTNGVHQAPGR